VAGVVADVPWVDVSREDEGGVVSVSVSVSASSLINLDRQL
jgi:hypothetical protein